MGNSLACFSQPKKVTDHSHLPQSKNGVAPGHPLPPISAEDDALIRQQAMEAVLLFRQHRLHSRNSASLDRSVSVRDNAAASSMKKNQKQQLPRSVSVRPPSPTDALLHPPVLPQDVNGVADKHIVLVHGAGYGAWCWYKTLSLLHQSGVLVDAIDLAGSGIDSSDPNNVTSLQQYVKPLIDFLRRLDPGKKVMLVGHDFGGICISYAMEMFPSKVSKAVFITAVMVGGGQSAIDMFSLQTDAGSSMPSAKVVVHGNGEQNPPTSIVLDHRPLFNKSPEKDIALASVSMRPVPFAPLMERVRLSAEKYGRVPRFYVKTADDDIYLPMWMQESMIEANPPQQVFSLKASDHSPFFSKPQSLHRLLLGISNLLP